MLVRKSFHSAGQMWAVEECLCSGPWSLTAQILHAEGVAGLFRGLTPTFAREVPGYFFFFAGYEASRHLFTPPGKSKDEIGMARCSLGNK